MAHPFILLQLSDPHVGAKWGGRDPVERLRAAVDEVLRLPDAFDAVLVSGDLTDNGRPEEYVTVRAELERLGAPYYVLAGNHDLRAPLREAFGLAGEGEEPVEYEVDLGPLRLVVADTVVPGEDHGSLDDARLGRLESLLALAPEQPTILALHHPPLATGIAAWDGINLSAADRAGLAEVVARAPQLLAIVGGHLHRAMAGALGGVPVLAVPSVYAQVAPAFDVDEAPQVNAEPPAFALHVLREGELSSQVVPYSP